MRQVDRPAATQQRCGEVESGLFDLFAQMGATEEQLDFPVLYASAREVRWGRTRALTHIHTYTYTCSGSVMLLIGNISFIGDLDLLVCPAVRTA